MVLCEWFLLCDREAAGMSRGPIGGGEFALMPVCQRCADRLELPLVPLPEGEA
jgi:hypothetical protein